MLELKDKLTYSVKLPELRSALSGAFEGLSTGAEGSLLTIVSLLSFYRKNMNYSPNVDAENCPLQAKLMTSGVAFFGPMYREAVSGFEPTKAKIISVLEKEGFYTDPLVFLNGTLLSLYFTYLKETGIVSDRFFQRN